MTCQNRYCTWNVNQSIIFKTSKQPVDSTYAGMNTDEIGSPLKAMYPMLNTDLVTQTTKIRAIAC